MKRFIGWGLAVAGGAGTLWGGMCLVTGSLESQIDITPELSLNAMTAGLVGVAVLTIGLVWARD